MHVRITSDANKETGIGDIVDVVSGSVRKKFINTNFGDDVQGIAIILMCRSPTLKFSRRVKFSKADKHLYCDVFIPYDRILDDRFDKFSIVISEIMAQLSEVFTKMKFKDFDYINFLKQLSSDYYVIIQSAQQGDAPEPATIVDPASPTSQPPAR